MSHNILIRFYFCSSAICNSFIVLYIPPLYTNQCIFSIPTFLKSTVNPNSKSQYDLCLKKPFSSLQLKGDVIARALLGSRDTAAVLHRSLALPSHLGMGPLQPQKELQIFVGYTRSWIIEVIPEDL